MAKPTIPVTDPDGVAPLGDLGGSREDLLAMLLGTSYLPHDDTGAVNDMLKRHLGEPSSLDVGTPTMTSEQWNQPDAKSVDVSIGKPTLLNRDDGRGVSGVWQSADSQVEHHPATGVDVSMGQPQMLNEAVSANDPRASLLIQQQLAKAKALRQPPTQGQDEYAAATP